MNRILAICHSLSPEGLHGVNVFLRSLVQTFTMERFASIHILHGPAISRKDFPADIPIHLHPMPETQVGPAVYFHLSDLAKSELCFMWEDKFKHNFYHRGHCVWADNRPPRYGEISLQDDLD